MSFFEKIFGNYKTSSAEDLTNIAQAIVFATEGCMNGVRPIINDNVKESERSFNEMAVLLLFLFFFLHHVNRLAFKNGYTNQQFEKLHDFILQNLVNPLADSFATKGQEANMRNEIVNRLNTTETEYSESKELISKENPFTGNSVAAKLARAISENCGTPMNPATLMGVQIRIMDTLLKINFENLILKGKKSI